MVIKSVLADREKRNEEIRNLCKMGAVACVKANTPGTDKNTPYAKLLFSYFTMLLKKKGLAIEKTLSGADGDCALFLLKNGRTQKNKFVAIEEKHPLGRLIDIDVTEKNAEVSLSRPRLRKCFLCDKPAFYCGREKAHPLSELLGHIKRETEGYFTELLSKMIEESMLNELRQKDKFGLVCKNTNGSHKDLDYTVMKRAIDAVKIPLTKCFFVGLNAKDSENMLNFLRPIGLDCEEKMYQATNGANAYKGFIFIGGVLLAGVGYLISRSLPLSSLQSVIQSICKGIDDAPNKDAFGYKAYHERGFGGIRKLCLEGFSVVIDLSKNIEKQPLLQSLCDIVGRIDDSVLLKRSGTLERYAYFKNAISSVDIRDKKQVKKVNQECLQNNVSIGGSADVLIATILLNNLLKTFYVGEL